MARELVTFYKIFHLLPVPGQTDLTDDELVDYSEPDYVLGTVRVSYVDHSVVEAFDNFYSTEEEALEDIRKLAPNNMLLTVMKCVCMQERKG